MWVKLLMNKWVLGVGATVLALFLVWNSGRLRGFDSGFSRAEGIYLGKVEEAIRSTVDNRDKLWTEEVGRVFGDLKDVLEKNNNTASIETSLAKSLAELRDELEKIGGAIPSTDLGGCNLTPDFDRLLDDKRDTDP